MLCPDFNLDDRYVHSHFCMNGVYLPYTYHTLLRETGMLTMGSSDKFTMGTIRCLQRHGIAHEVFDYRGIKQAYPMIEYPKDYTFVVDKSGGILRADKALLAYHVRIPRRGENSCRLNPHTHTKLYKTMRAQRNNAKLLHKSKII